jgi:radical SAM protein with 4Fe4S-binding SPASM domain
MADQMEDIIKKAWADITNLRFAKLPARDDKKCRNCDFDGICWA